MRLIRFFAIGIALSVAPSGCAASLTHVEHGEVFITGQSDYDEFFQGVHDVEKQIENAKSDRSAARERLLTALSLDADAQPRAPFDAAAERAKRMRDNGVFLHLYLTPRAEMLSVVGTIPMEDADANLLREVEQVASDALGIMVRAGEIVDRVAALEKQRGELSAGVEQAFGADAKTSKSEVTRELSAAKDVLAEAAKRSSAEAGAAAKLAVNLAQAVETGAVAEKVAPPPPPPPKKKWTGGGKPSKPKPADDFEP